MPHKQQDIAHMKQQQSKFRIKVTQFASMAKTTCMKIHLAPRFTYSPSSRALNCVSQSSEDHFSTGEVVESTRKSEQMDLELRYCFQCATKP